MGMALSPHTFPFVNRAGQVLVMGPCQCRRNPENDRCVQARSIKSTSHQAEDPLAAPSPKPPGKPTIGSCARHPSSKTPLTSNILIIVTIPVQLNLSIIN
eukprot:1179829-Prorocentrum_minimum.AAC.1